MKSTRQQRIFLRLAFISLYKPPVKQRWAPGRVVIQFLVSGITTLNSTVRETGGNVRGGCRVVGGLVLLLAALFFVPASGAQRYTFRTYVEGLGNLNVTSLYQDTQGFLWIGTQGGLFRYDGYRFDEFGPKEGLTVPFVQDVYQDLAGRLWVISPRGLFVRTDQRFQEAVPESAPLAITRMGSLFTSLPDGTLVASGDHGLYTLRRPQQPAGWQATPLLPPDLIDKDTSAPHGVVTASDGAVWFGCGVGICKYHDSTLNKWDEKSGLPKGAWKYLLFDHEHNLWARNTSHIAVLKPGATRFELRDIPGAPPVLDYATLALDAQGRPLAPCGNKLARYEGDHWRLFSDANGLPGETITAAMADREGSVWIGTLGRGLQRWLGYDQWEHWTKQDGLHSDIVWALFRDHTGRLWVGDDKGISIMTGESRQLHSWSVPGIVVEGYTSIGESNDGYVWIGARNFALRIDSATLQTKRFPIDDLARLYVDSRGRVWGATLKGLFVSEPGASGKGRAPFRRLQAAGLPEGPILDIAETADGKLWLACGDGLVTGGLDGWSRLDLDWKGLGTKELLDVTVDHSGNLWLDGYFSGALRLQLRNSQVVRVDRFQRPTVASDHFALLEPDKRGWMWLGGDRGIDVFDGQRWHRYTQDNGLVWNDIAERSFWADSDGSVWIGTGGGLSHFTPHDFAAVPPPAPVFESARFGSGDISNGASVHWSSNPLTIKLASLTFRDEKALRFRYRLTGFEQQWTDTDEHEVRYPQLPPGSYQLQVMAISGSDATLSPVSTFSFRIQPPWLRSNTFHVAAGLIGLLLLGTAWRWSQERAVARKNGERSRKAALYARNLIEASLDPLVTISREGKITDVNQATELITGVHRELLIGSDFSDYFTDPDKARDVYQQVFATGRVRDYPLALRNSTGGVSEVLYNATVFRNESGEVEGVFAAARDITERKQLEEQLLQSQKLEAIGQLAGGVAHDFNNIMGVILGYAELAQIRMPMDDPVAKHVSRIRKAAERAAALTRQLLAFSRKQVLQPEVLNLNQVVVELAKMLGLSLIHI